MMRLAVHWADLHIADPEFAEACFTSPKTFAGEGSPSIDEFCVPEFATMLGRTNDSAGRFLTECVEVAYRLPRLWGAVLVGLVAGWRARIIAQTTLALTLEAATHVDEQVFWCASRLTPSSWVGWSTRPGSGSCPTPCSKALDDSADKRHVTFDTEQASFDGTMHLEADLEIPDALALAEAVASRCGAPREARVHRHRRRTPRHRAGRPGPAPADHRLRRPGPTRCDRLSVVEVRAQRASKPSTSSREAGDPDPPLRPPVRGRDHPRRQPGRAGRGVVRAARAGRPTAAVGGPDPRLVRTPRRAGGRHQVIDLRERLECQGYRPTPGSGST